MVNQMTNEKTLWFVTHSEVGPCDPNGFFCHGCYVDKIETVVGFIQELVSIVEPENTPYYTCNCCNKDYRD